MLQKVSKAEAQCSGPVQWLQLVEKGTSRYQSTAAAYVKNTIKCNKKSKKQMYSLELLWREKLSIEMKTLFVPECKTDCLVL